MFLKRLPKELQGSIEHVCGCSIQKFVKFNDIIRSSNCFPILLTFFEKFFHFATVKTVSTLVDVHLLSVITSAHFNISAVVTITH